MKKYQLYGGSKEVIHAVNARSEDKIRKIASRYSQEEFEMFVAEELGACGANELQGEYETLEEAKKNCSSGWRIEGTAYGMALEVECSQIDEVTAWDEDGNPTEWERACSEYPQVKDIAGDYGKNYRIRETTKDGARTIYDEVYYGIDEAEEAIRDFMEDDEDDPERDGIIYDLVEVI